MMSTWNAFEMFRSIRVVVHRFGPCVWSWWLVYDNLFLKWLFFCQWIKDMEGNTHDEVGLRLLHGGKVDDHNAVDHHHAAHHAVKEIIISSLVSFLIWILGSRMVIPRTAKSFEISLTSSESISSWNLSIMKRKVKMQSHFSPPCGGRNSFGIAHKLPRFPFTPRVNLLCFTPAW